MGENEFTFETVHQVVLKEKKYNQAKKLDANFWEKCHGLLDEYKRSYQEELAKSPGSFLTVELAMNIRKLLQQINQVYRFRERKVLILALEKIDNPSMVAKNLLPLEEELLDRSVALLAHNRELTPFSNESSFLDNLPPQIGMPVHNDVGAPYGLDRDVAMPVPGEEIPADGMEIPADGMEIPADGMKIPADGMKIPADGMKIPADGMEMEGKNVTEAEEMGPSRVPETSVAYEAQEDFDDYIRVRITKGDREQSFVGLDDHNYILRKEDLLYLPKTSGEFLVKGDHAEIV